MRVEIISTWLLSGESLVHWLVNSALGTLEGFMLATLILGPIVKHLLNPYTPGGLGDIPDADGVKAHVRLAQHQEVHHG